jgi:hypothetical protein
VDRDARLTDVPERGAADERVRAPRRGRPGRWLLSLVGFLGVAAAATYFLAVEGARRRLREHREGLPKQWAALPLMPGRPAVLEPYEPGEAARVRADLFAAVEAVPYEERSWVTETWTGPRGGDGIFDRHPEPLRLLLRLPHVPVTPTSISLAALSTSPWSDSDRWAEAAFERAMRSKDPELALRIALAGLVLGADMERVGSHASWLVGSVAEVAWSERMRRALDLRRPSPHTAPSLRRALETIERTRAPVTFAVPVERVFVTEQWTGEFGRRAGLRLREEIGWRHVWSADVYVARRLEDDLDELNALERRIQTVDLHAPTAPSLLDAENLGDPPVRFALWSDAASFRLSARAWNAVLRAGFAIIEKGPAPTVEEADLPVDPWSEKPVRFDGSSVWSIGPDRVDDGGDAEKDLVVALPR